MRRVVSRNKDFADPIGQYAKKDKIPIGRSEIFLFAFIVFGIFVTALTYYLFSSEEGVIYERVGGVVHVTGYSGNESSIEILDEYEGRRVTTIAQEAFKDNETIQSITLGKNIEVIERKAFYNASALESFTLPQEIDLKRIYYDILFNTPYHTQQDSLYYLGDALYYAQEYQEETLEIPENTKLIGVRAFYDNEHINSIYFNPKLRYINDEAFAEMNQLQRLFFESDIALQSIGRLAFYNATNLNNISEPSATQITHIGSDAFFQTPWRLEQDESYYQFGDIRIEEPLE